MKTCTIDGPNGQRRTATSKEGAILAARLMLRHTGQEYQWAGSERGWYAFGEDGQMHPSLGPSRLFAPGAIRVS